MNYKEINTSTFYQINGNLPLASIYYNKIFKCISGPPPWLLHILYKAFEEVETPRGSFLHYNPHWNKTIKEEIARLQKEESSKKAGATEMDEEKSSGDTELAVAQRLERLEHLMKEMNDRLKSIESHLTRQ